MFKTFENYFSKYYWRNAVIVFTRPDVIVLIIIVNNKGNFSYDKPESIEIK